MEYARYGRYGTLIPVKKVRIKPNLQHVLDDLETGFIAGNYTNFPGAS
jgi:hypothetical protein